MFLPSEFKRPAAVLASAAVCSACFSGIPVNAAADGQPVNIVILGDSISSGYGLNTDPHSETGEERGYYDYLAACLNGNVTNLAVSGYTTQDVIGVIDNAENKGAIAAADLICISAGANDLVGAAKTVLGNQQQEGETLIDTAKRLATEGDPVQLISDLTGALREPRAKAKENYTVIVSKLRALNPDAQIIMQTIYNPLEVPDSILSEKNIDKTEYQKLVKYVANNEKVLNNAMTALEGVKVADVSAAFTGKTENTWLYDRILEKDVHPNALGHALIAALVMETAQMPAEPCAEMRHMLDLTAKSADTAGQISSENMNLLKKYAIDQIPQIAGDLNYDGRISVSDAVMLSRFIAEDQTLTLTEQCILNADFDGDGMVTLTDIRALLKKIA